MLRYIPLLSLQTVISWLVHLIKVCSSSQTHHVYHDLIQCILSSGTIHIFSLLANGAAVETSSAVNTDSNANPGPSSPAPLVATRPGANDDETSSAPTAGSSIYAYLH